MLKKCSRLNCRGLFGMLSSTIRVRHSGYSSKSFKSKKYSQSSQAKFTHVIRHMNATSLVDIIGRQNVRQSFEIFNAASFDNVLIQAVFVVPNKTVYLNFDNNDKKPKSATVLSLGGRR